MNELKKMKNKRDGETYYPHHICPETPLNLKDCVVDNKKELIVEGKLPPKTLIEIIISKKEYKETYSLRGRIGIFILRMLGVVTLEFTNKNIL